MAGTDISWPRNDPIAWSRRWVQAALLVVTISIASWVSSIARDTDHPVTAAVVFILAVLVNGTVGGLTFGLLAAVFASVIYNFFIRFPVYQFGFDTIDDFVPLVALTVTAIVSGVLSGRLADRARVAEDARRQLADLLQLSNALQSAVTIEQIVGAVVSNLHDPSAIQSAFVRMESEYAFRHPQIWLDAVAHQRKLPVTGSSSTGMARQIDQEMVIRLLKMAVERCELLEEEAHAQAVRASEQLKTALLSSLSHDLRTPLAAISTSVDGLIHYGDKIEVADRDAMLHAIQDQSAKLGRFIQQIMSMARLEAGLEAKDLEIVDIEEALGSVLTTLHAQRPTRTILRRIEASQCLTTAQPALLQQALYNVVDNALRYSEPETHVIVSLTAQDNMFVVSVSDEGCGIDRADLAHIFERFYRGSNNSDRSGQGLGLSIAKTFVDVLGGSIDVVSPSNEGRGTTVHIRLPRAVWQGADTDNG